MALFKISGTVVHKLKARDLDLEKHLQALLEQNLEEILNIDFLAHEYSTSSRGRIDTLGIDKDGAPCVIEYKKGQNHNVINQGLSYLRWLLDHRADFKILCQSKKITTDIEWDAPRVICIAASFNKFDLDTVDILPIHVELLRYRIYDDDILYIEPEAYQKSRKSEWGIQQRGKLRGRRQQLQKTYSVDDLLNGVRKPVVDMFQDLRHKILALDQNIIEDVKSKYIAYRTSTNFLNLVIKKFGLKIYLNVKSGELNDPNNLARDLAKQKLSRYWRSGDYEIRLDREPLIEPVLALIKQSYDFNK